MRKLRKAAWVAAIVLVLAALFLVIGRNVILRVAIPRVVHKITGFQAGLSGIDVGLISHHVAIHNLEVLNPADFPDHRMLVAPEIYVAYKPLTMMGPRREFPTIKLDIQEVVVVKNARGESNVARIMEHQPRGGSGKTANHFGTLELSLGKITFLDFSRMRNDKPFTREVTLNFHNTYHDLLDSDVTKVVMLETLKMLPAQLRDITPESIQKDLGGVTGVGIGVATNLQHEASGFLEQVGGLFHSKSNAPSRGR